MFGNVLLHVGYHKTGTTWFQRHVFSNTDLGFFQPITRRDIIERFVLCRPFQFSAASERSYVDEKCASATARIPVLSAERLSGNPHSGGYDSEVIARRLSETFPSAKVFICFREQHAMLASIYQQYVREGGVASLARYVNPPAQGDARVPMFEWDYLQYDRLVAGYRSFFGADNVLAMPYEWFFEDPLDFVSRLAAFAGGVVPSQVSADRPNASLSGIGLLVKRLGNLMLVRDRLNPLAPVENRRVSDWCLRGALKIDRYAPQSIKDILRKRRSAHVASLIGDRLDRSNERLATMLSMDLDRLGYRVSG